MCEKCVDIDHQVELYRKLSLAVCDQAAAVAEKIKMAATRLAFFHIRGLHVLWYVANLVQWQLAASLFAFLSIATGQ